MISRKIFPICNNVYQPSQLITRCYFNQFSRFILSSANFQQSQRLFNTQLRRNNYNRLERVKLSSVNQDEDEDANQFLPLDELKNEPFEQFLKAQEMVKDENEWNQLMTIMREPLPTSIRVNKNPFNQHLLVKEYMETKASSEWFVDTSGKQYLSKYPWYPEGLAYYFGRDAPLNKSSFGFFAKSGKFSGSVYFQEAVSMIPILSLDIKPNHSILDMCASPGSKTTQALQQLNSFSPLTNITGCLIANDIETTRVAKLIVHAKHLCYPQLIITKGNASNFPPLQDDNLPTFYHKFDRILCDVSCTGDGTVRKNHGVWKIWDPIFFHRFHFNQLKIIKRAVTLLAKDGLIVYSTCSLNPVENEAVIASLINQSNGSLELVDCHQMFPSLNCIHGLSRWKIMQPDGSIISDYSEKNDEKVLESMFPPENIDSIGIDRCLRILPHHFNNGGFFIALIRKNDQVPWESSLPYHRQKVDESIKLKFLNSYDPDWLEIKETFKLPDDFPCEQLVSSSEINKRIHFVTKDAKRIIIDNSDKLNIIHVGVGVFERVNLQKQSQFRLMSEGFPIILPHLPDDLIITVDLERFHQLVLQGSEINCAKEKEMINLDNGSYVIQCKLIKNQNGSDETITLAVPILKLHGRVIRFISHAVKVNYLRLLGFLTQNNSDESSA